MFRRLKMQLILINLSLLVLVLAVIFSAIYFSMEQGMERQTEDQMRRIAQSEHLPPSGPPQPPGQKPGVQQAAPDLFYVKVNSSGQIQETSPNLPVAAGDLQALIKGSVTGVDQMGTIRYDNVDYSYLKAPKSYGYFLVFYNRTISEQVLSRLVLDSLIIGGLSLIMVFLISLYLANRALAPIKNAWDKQRAFVADASHELRTPLAVISTNLELVLGNAEETVGSQSKWLGYIQSEIQRMSKVVADLLFLARADANESVAMSMFDLSKALNEAVLPLVPFAALKGIELAADIQPEALFYGNEGRVKQLAAILIDNAIKHTDAGGRVELILLSGIHAVEIVVSDTGEGIPQGDLDRIFERFYRVDESRSRERGGTGLGLSIADCIVKEHRGNIKVSSVVGKGTVFTVTLPKLKHELSS